MIVIAGWQAMAERADFNSRYLHLAPPSPESLAA